MGLGALLKVTYEACFEKKNYEKNLKLKKKKKKSIKSKNSFFSPRYVLDLITKYLYKILFFFIFITLKGAVILSLFFCFPPQLNNF